MRCPACNNDETRTLSTREHKHGLYVRTHQCKCGERFKSVQVLERVYECEPLPPIEPLPAAPRKPAMGEHRRKVAARVVLPTEPATWLRGL